MKRSAESVRYDGLLRDEAARLRWRSPHLLRVFPSHGSPARDLDARTGSFADAGSSPAAPAVRGLQPVPRRSRPAGDSCHLVFKNAAGEAVQLGWVKQSGEVVPYAVVSAGDSMRQQTYGGHAWQAIGVASNRHFGYMVANGLDQTVVIREDAGGGDGGGSAAIDDGGGADCDSVGSGKDDNSDDGVDEFTFGGAGAPPKGPLRWNPERTHCVAWDVVPTPFGERTITLVESAPPALESSSVRGAAASSGPASASFPAPQPLRTRSLRYPKPGDHREQRWPRLFLAPLSTAGSPTTLGQEIPVDRSPIPRPFSMSGGRWSADGRFFFFLYNERGHARVRLCALNAATGGVDVVIDEVPPRPTFVDYSQKVYLHWLGRHDADGAEEALWFSERDGHNHLFLMRFHAPMQPSGGSAAAASSSICFASAATAAGVTVQLMQLTKGAFVVRRIVHLDFARRDVVLCILGFNPGEDPYHEHFFRLSIPDGSAAGAPPVLLPLTRGDGTHILLFSPSSSAASGSRGSSSGAGRQQLGEYYVDTWSRVDSPPVHELRRSADGSLIREIARADASALLASGWQYPLRLACAGRDGSTPIYGMVWLPERSTMPLPPSSIPVVDWVYAGPQDYHTPKAFSLFKNAATARLTSCGFAVCQVDGMGTNWRSKAFHDVCYRNVCEGGLPDHILFIRAATAAYPALDISRGVGIVGGSAGGQTAMRALIDYSDFYRVAVAVAGCHDNRVDKLWWNEAWMGVPEPGESEAAYVRNSNIAQAHRLRGHLMLMVGELDENVDPSCTYAAGAALQTAGILHELVVIAGGGHHAADETPYGFEKRQEFIERHMLFPRPGSA